LISIIENMTGPKQKAEPPFHENEFVRVLQARSAELEAMSGSRERWTAKEWTVFRELEAALKKHANLVSPVWVLAAGLHPPLAEALSSTVLRIRHVQFNRRLLSWDECSSLPLALD
jgi:hypothetical protein